MHSSLSLKLFVKSFDRAAVHIKSTSVQVGSARFKTDKPAFLQRHEKYFQFEFKTRFHKSTITSVNVVVGVAFK